MTLFDVKGLDHVGIRVSDAKTAVEFYKRLGFVNAVIDQDGDYELTTPGGLRINLIPNATGTEGHNVLLDEPVKLPGYTHAAFIIDDLEAAMKAVTSAGIEITEGPNFAPRRTYFFIRDPDGNVLEFNQLNPLTP